VPSAFGLLSLLSVSLREDLCSKCTTVTHLLLDLSYFLSDYNGNRIPSHPALVAIILHTVFSSHGGNLEEYLGDGTQLDVVFALAGTAICSVLMEYQTGTHHHLDFGSEMSGRFNDCMNSLEQIRANPQLAAILDTIQNNIVTRGKQIM